MSNSKPNITADERNAIAQYLLESCSKGKPPRGKFSEASSKFGYSRRTISTIWARAKQQMNSGMSISLTNKKIFTLGRGKIVCDKELLKQIPVQKRRSYRSIAHEMNVSKSIVAKWFKCGVIGAHTNQVKPCLNQKNKLSRLKFSLEALEVDLHENVVKFKDMQQTVHIDEKWFNLSRANERFYIAEGEEDPYRTCQNKRFITKVMFLCAVARPLYNENGECLFDGKIGIFPFTEQVPALRNSINRPAGTLETKAIKSITKEVTKQCLINQLIPAIKAMWPNAASKDILIQQDNARPHLKDDDPEFREAASADGFNIHLVFQPPNSPDTNINDLGWFRALKSLQKRTATYTIDQLLDAVRLSFEELSHEKLNCVFFSLQDNMIQMMKVRGHNNYKQAHMGKEALMRADLLPHVLEVEQKLVKKCIAYLGQNNATQGLEEFITAMDYLPELDETDEEGIDESVVEDVDEVVDDAFEEEGIEVFDEDIHEGIDEEGMDEAFEEEGIDEAAEEVMDG